MADIIALDVFILLKPWLLFVNGIIGQMHTKVIQVRPTRALILFRGESRKTFFVNEAP
jgi:hypothetical protein